MDIWAGKLGKYVTRVDKCIIGMSMKNKILGVMLCIVVIGVMGCKENHDNSKRNKKNVAYALRRGMNEGKRVTYLSHINLEDIDIEREVEVPHEYSYVFLKDSGNVVMVFSRNSSRLFNVIDEYNPEKDQLKKYIRTKDNYPSTILTHNDRHFVLIGGHHSGPLKLEVYKKNKKFIKSLELSKKAMSIYGSIIAHKKELYIFINEFVNPEKDDDPYLIKVNTETLAVEKKDYHFSDYFRAIDGVALHKSEKKIYIAPLAVQNFKKGENKSLFVFSFPEFDYLNKIDLGKQPDDVIYIPETDKLYINHGLSISVVECQTEKVIKVLPYHAYRVEDVGGGKVMLSHSEHVFDTDEVTGTMTTLYVDQKLVVIDTKTDTVLKEFVGEYGPISKFNR